MSNVALFNLLPLCNLFKIITVEISVYVSPIMNEKYRNYITHDTVRPSQAQTIQVIEEAINEGNVQATSLNSHIWFDHLPFFLDSLVFL